MDHLRFRTRLACYQQGCGPSNPVSHSNPCIGVFVLRTRVAQPSYTTGIDTGPLIFIILRAMLFFFQTDPVTCVFFIFFFLPVTFIYIPQ